MNALTLRQRAEGASQRRRRGIKIPPWAGGLRNRIKITFTHPSWEEAAYDLPHHCRIRRAKLGTTRCAGPALRETSWGNQIPARRDEGSILRFYEIHVFKKRRGGRPSGRNMAEGDENVSVFIIIVLATD